MPYGRRHFLHLAAVSAALSACSARGFGRRRAGAVLEGVKEQGLIVPIRPPALRAGDTISLICPAGPIDAGRLRKATDNLNALGFKAKVGAHALERYGYTAGTVEQRLKDFHAAFADDEVKAVWAVRGGYGATALLPNLDYDLIRSKPKLLIGYSDLTAPLNAIYQRTGLIGIHGPVASSTFAELARESFDDVAVSATIPCSYTCEARTRAPSPKISGRATGKLAGGNLTLLAAMCGTPFQLDVKDKLLLLEDVGEAPYRIDRMLVQLDQACDLSSAAGIALGEFVDCEAAPGDNSLTLAETLANRLSGLGIPVAGQFPFGHGDRNVSLPIGVVATLDADEGSLTLIEAAVR